MPPPPLLLLAGPTAVGKSAVALCLAEHLAGEIVSVDSMQVYRGLDIGTAKPSWAERRRVPHHLIDVAAATEPFDAAQFVRLARAAVKRIRARGRLPILCGGTGLYFKAFLEGLGDGPSVNLALRALLEAEPPARLLRELQVRDPATYARIDRNNPRRVVRAVEMIRLTGRPASDLRAPWSTAAEPAGGPGNSPALRLVQGGGARETAPSHPGAHGKLARPPFVFFGLRRSREDLRGRIELRVAHMFARGLVEETRGLLERGLATNRTAMQAIGYRQVAEYLGGARSLAETIALVRTRTRQFARRQETWFRRQLPLHWFDIQPDEPAESVAGQIEAFLRAG